MRDFFCNEKLVGIVPQIEAKCGGKNALKAKEIFAQCQIILNKALGGAIEGNKIIVRVKSRAKVLATVNAYKPILEAMFSSAEQVVASVKTNNKLYMTVANLSAASELKTTNARVKLMADILDNLRFNPDFLGANKLTSIEKKLQADWKKKVNYKERK